MDPTARPFVPSTIKYLLGDFQKIEEGYRATSFPQNLSQYLAGRFLDIDRNVVQALDLRTKMTRISSRLDSSLHLSVILLRSSTHRLALRYLYTPWKGYGSEPPICLETGRLSLL